MWGVVGGNLGAPSGGAAAPTRATAAGTPATRQGGRDGRRGPEALMRRAGQGREEERTQAPRRPETSHTLQRGDAGSERSAEEREVPTRPKGARAGGGRTCRFGIAGELFPLRWRCAVAHRRAFRCGRCLCLCRSLRLTDIGRPMCVSWSPSAARFSSLPSSM